MVGFWAVCCYNARNASLFLSVLHFLLCAKASDIYRFVIVLVLVWWYSVACAKEVMGGKRGEKERGGGGVDDLVYTPDLCTEFGIQSEKATRHSYIGSIFVIVFLILF